MARLGLGYDDVRALNPRLIYCSISGYGQSGPRADEAGHDINYIGNTGLLDLQPGPIERPVVPPMLVADIAGGSFPAVINILLALRARDRSGQGCHLDIAMTDAMFTFAWYALALGSATGRFPAPGELPLAGGSPRYQLLSDQGRQDRRLRRARAEILDGVHGGDRIGGGIRERPARSAKKATRAAVAKLVAARTAGVAAGAWPPPIAAPPSSCRWKRPCATRISSSAACSRIASRRNRARRCRRCRCRSRRSFATSRARNKRRS